MNKRKEITYTKWEPAAEEVLNKALDELRFIFRLPFKDSVKFTGEPVYLSSADAKRKLYLEHGSKLSNAIEKKGSFDLHDLEDDFTEGLHMPEWSNIQERKANRAIERISRLLNSVGVTVQRVGNKTLKIDREGNKPNQVEPKTERNKYKLDLKNDIDNYWVTAYQIKKDDDISWPDVYKKICQEMERLGLPLHHTTWGSFKKRRGDYQREYGYPKGVT